MKSIKYLVWSFLAAGALLTACTEDPAEYPAGGPENKDSYFVSFPLEQFDSKHSGNISMLPEEPATITFTAVRERTDGAITVPVLVDADTSVFDVEPIYFADGAGETTFSVNFPNAELGVNYPFLLTIDDPDRLYTGIYSNKQTVIEFSVSRVNWITVDPDNVIDYVNPVTGEQGTYTGYCEYTDDLITTFFNVDAWTYPVKVEVREDTFDPETLAGLYRMVSPYGAAYPANDPGDYTEGNVYIEINATNPKKVYINMQRMGMDWGYGEFVVYSLAADYIKADKEEDAAPYYGRIENGAIVFPQKALLIAMMDYSDGGFYYANGDGKFKLVLDHTLNVDYSLTFDSGNAVNGVKPIYVNMGSDLLSVKYAVYDGELLASQITTYANGIADGTEASQEITESGTIQVERGATGLYTLVAIGLIKDDDGNDEVVTTETYTFGFVASGDDKSVVMNLGIDDTSARYASQGYNTENSMELWANAQDVEWVLYNVYKTSNLAGASDDDIIADMLDEESGAQYFTDAQIAELNGNGTAFIIGDLIAGTDYTVAVYAFNGYNKDLFKVKYKTSGFSHPLFGDWTFDDMYGITKQELFKTWYMWAVDYDDEDGITDRQAFVRVTFSENSNDFVDEESVFGGNVDAINISGFGLGLTTNDTHVWEYYGGYILNYYTHNNIGQWQSYYINYVPYVGGLGTYNAFYDEIMIGGLVDDGYMALAFSGFYDLGGNPEPNGFQWTAYSNANCTTSLGYLLRLYNLMFEDPAVSSLSSVNKPVHVKNNVQQLNTMAKEMATPSNYVELRGRARAHALIDELNSRTLRSAAHTTKVIENKHTVKQANVKTTFTSGVPARTFDKSIKNIDATSVNVSMF